MGEVRLQEILEEHLVGGDQGLDALLRLLGELVGPLVLVDLVGEVAQDLVEMLEMTHTLSHSGCRLFIPLRLDELIQTLLIGEEHPE